MMQRCIQLCKFYVNLTIQTHVLYPETSILFMCLIKPEQEKEAME